MPQSQTPHRLVSTLHRETHPPLRHPQSLSEKPQRQNDEPSSSCDARLRGECTHGSGLDDPIDLDIRSHEPSHRLAHDDPRADLAAAFGIRVQEVRAQRDGRDHDAHDLPGEEDRDHDVVVGVSEGEAEHEDRYGHDGGGQPDDDEAGFGLDVAGVPAHVVVADGIVEPVA